MWLKQRIGAARPGVDLHQGACDAMASTLALRKAVLMPKQKTTWIVIADSSRAQILTRRVERPGFDVITAFESPDAHASAHQLGADRPGRVQESAYSAHHAVEPRIDPHEESQIQFLRTVAAYLNENGTREEVRDLILFAPPRALGHLRKLLDAAVVRKIRAEAPKDLTQVPIAELPKHLDALP